ncbi:uncharacterized protein [Hyperolius riggenbachi]|uniref:uncharacterized protein n=1 Tax=Hyperolius riggenbachi TaxID=752182 RepID=UPI0035A39443
MSKNIKREVLSSRGTASDVKREDLRTRGAPSDTLPDSEQSTDSSRNSHCQTQLLDAISSTGKKDAHPTASPPELVNAFSQAGGEANHETAGESDCFAGSQYAQHCYTEYMMLYHLMNGGLATVTSEMAYLGRQVSKLSNGIKECSNTMDFYVTKMLSFQKEMLHSLNKTNNSLKFAVHRLSQIKENQEQQPKHVEKENGSRESDEASTNWRERENRRRSRSREHSTHRYKRYKDK